MTVKKCERLSDIAAEDWNALVPDHNPFLLHEFLSGLENTGCVNDETGWRPQHLLLYQSGAQGPLAGAMPLYMKSHSYGEYVFDWAWADAYHRSGLTYYPKLVCAVPFTPATGPRMLVNPEIRDPGMVRSRLLEEARELADSLGASSVHWLFTTPTDTHALRIQGMLVRTGNQFHWTNKGYRTFDEFLQSLTSKRRKQIRRERKSVRASGLSVDAVEGTEIRSHHLDLMYDCYRMTISERGAIPYLSKAFFEHLGRAMQKQLVLFLAHADGGIPVAGAMCLKGSDTLYGRYWGSKVYCDGLHFDACYYRPIEYCIDNGLSSFEAGAQGEHKLNRGLVPTPTYSGHWLRHEGFRDAVRDFLQAETEHVDEYSAALARHSPYRTADT